MKIRYHNFHMICGRVYFLANGMLREARYTNKKSDMKRKTLAA